MSSSSQKPRAYGKLDAMFSSKSNEPGKQFKNSIFKFADPSNLGRSLLEGNKDHLISQAGSELMKQEHQVGSLNNCNENYRTHIPRSSPKKSRLRNTKTQDQLHKQ